MSVTWGDDKARNKRAAWMIWAEFRACMMELGRDWSAVYASIAAGDKGMGDYCDDNLIYHGCMVDVGLLPEDIDGADESQCAVWNETVGVVYQYTAWGKK